MSNPDFQNSTVSADTSIGFDYQFYYFFYQLLFLRHGQKIGLEVKDDIHIELADGKIKLLQLKHTLQKNASGQAINLTERDKDLWKTLSNWMKFIQTQKSEERKTYLENTTFHLVSNKNDSNKNPFISKINELKTSPNTQNEIRPYLQSLHSTTTDKKIKEHIQELLNASDRLLLPFLKKIEFDLDVDDIIEKIKKRLLEQLHIPERIEDVYNSLNSTLRDNNYLEIKKGEKIEISFEDFNKKFRKCFSIGFTNKLPIRDFTITIPNNPLDQLFIKQLIDIGDISEDDKDIIIEYTTHMLKLYNNLKEWENAGDLLPAQRKSFDKNTISKWKNSFHSEHRKIKNLIKEGKAISECEIEAKECALSCLDEMKKEILNIDETLLDMELSNGHFYLLTEGKEIGWHYDWKNRY